MNKNLKNKTAIYSYDDEKSRPCVDVVFEDAKYNFDLIEDTLNLYKDVKKKNIFSRAIRGTVEDTKVAITTMLDYLIKIDGSIFNKDFAKDFKMFTDDLRMAYINLENMTK